VFHGGGGFLHSEVYNMPIWLRRFHIQKINEYNKEENERIENTKKGSPLNPDKKIYGPNIKPSSVYNFKK
tara:strand:- start:11669 stop:11878 length:210 start_codon:yes stop_codon:yes gene_type:complete